MKRRAVLIISGIAILTVVTVGSIVAAVLQSQSQNQPTEAVKTENEKIIEVIASDEAPASFGLTPRAVAWLHKDGDWYLAKIRFSSATDSDTIYSTVLVKDSGGDFSIVVNVGDSLLREDLLARSIPESIVDTITNEAEPSDGLNYYE